MKRMTTYVKWVKEMRRTFRHRVIVPEFIALDLAVDEATRMFGETACKWEHHGDDPFPHLYVDDEGLWDSLIDEFFFKHEKDAIMFKMAMS